MSQEEVKLFENIPMQLNLGDYEISSHLGWATAYKNTRTGKIRIEIDLHDHVAERLEKDLLMLFDVKAIGFAGIAKKAEVPEVLVPGNLDNLITHLEASEAVPDNMMQLALAATGVKIREVPAREVAVSAEFVYEGRLYTVGSADDKELIGHQENGTTVTFTNPDHVGEQRPKGYRSWELLVITDAEPTETHIEEREVRELEPDMTFLYNGTLYVVEMKDEYGLTANCPGRPGVTFYNPDGLGSEDADRPVWTEKVLVDAIGKKMKDVKVYEKGGPELLKAIGETRRQTSGEEEQVSVKDLSLGDEFWYLDKLYVLDDIHPTGIWAHQKADPDKTKMFQDPKNARVGDGIPEWGVKVIKA